MSNAYAKMIAESLEQAAGITWDGDENMNMAGYLKRISEAAEGLPGAATGTAFPTSPTTDDRFYRTDLRREYFYDGTRWLSADQDVLTFPFAMAPATASGPVCRNANPGAGWADIYLEQITWYGKLDTTGDWTLSLYSYDALAFTLRGSKTFTSTNRISVTDQLGIVLPSAADTLEIDATENSGTAIFHGGASLRYRLIG